MKRFPAVAAAFAAGVFMMSASVAQAVAPSYEVTYISGTVYDSTHNPVNGGSVQVTCNGKVRSVTIQSDGTYAAVYPQTDCKSGDSVTASATTSEGTGSASDQVEDTVANGAPFNLDIAVVDITVPELGLIGGAVAGLGSIAGYLWLRAKAA